MERGVTSTYPSQVDVANHRRERLRQLREERSRDSPLLKLPGGERDDQSISLAKLIFNAL
jgi:hypothetical protein